MILTNKFSVKYNMERINRDFDVFALEAGTSYFNRTNILDMPTEQFRAKAVQYAYGGKAFVLFKKKIVNERTFREAICSEYDDAKVRKIDLLDAKEWEQFGDQKYLLLRLLTNSIRVPDISTHRSTRPSLPLAD